MKERLGMGVKARLKAGKANTGQDRYGYFRVGDKERGVQCRMTTIERAKNDFTKLDLEEQVKKCVAALQSEIVLQRGYRKLSIHHRKVRKQVSVLLRNQGTTPIHQNTMPLRRTVRNTIDRYHVRGLVFDEHNRGRWT